MFHGVHGYYFKKTFLPSLTRFKPILGPKTPPSIRAEKWWLQANVLRVRSQIFNQNGSLQVKNSGQSNPEMAASCIASAGLGKGDKRESCDASII